MVSLFSIARSTALAALALGAGALLAPAPADAAQGRGYSGGGRSMGYATRGMAAPRMAAPRMAYGAGVRGYAPRGVAPRVYGRNFAYPAGGYRYAGVNTQRWRPPVHRPYPRPRPPYYGGGWYGGGYYPYWGVGAGLGLGLASAAYYANNSYYADDCWLEKRWVRTNYGRRLANVRVCYGY